MGIKFDFRSVPADEVAKLSKGLQQTREPEKASKLTEEGKKLGVKVFDAKTVDYVDQRLLVYIPKMEPFVNEDDKRVFLHHNILATHRLAKLGDTSEDNFAGNLVSTLNVTGFEAFGVSGKAEVLFEYIQKSKDYFWSLVDYETVLQGYAPHGINSAEGSSGLNEMPKKERSELLRSLNNAKPIGDAKERHWFPIVVIDTQKDASTGKNTLTPVQHPLLDAEGNQVLDENGNPRFTLKGEMMWYPAPIKVVQDLLPKASKAISSSGDVDVSGNFFEFSFEIPDSKRANLSETGVNSKNAVSVKEMSVTVLPDFNPIYKPLYEVSRALGLLDSWDALVKEGSIYSDLALVSTVTDWNFLSDDEMKTRLDSLYGNIDAEIEAIKAKTQKTLSMLTGGTANIEQGQSSALMGAIGLGVSPQGIAPQGVATQGIPAQGVAPQGVAQQGVPAQGVSPQGEIGFEGVGSSTPNLGNVGVADLGI